MPPISETPITCFKPDSEDYAVLQILVIPTDSHFKFQGRILFYRANSQISYVDTERFCNRANAITQGCRIMIKEGFTFDKRRNVSLKFVSPPAELQKMAEFYNWDD